MLPCPDDIAPIIPFAGTQPCSASITRMGPSAFVSITRLKSLVVATPNGMSCSRVVVPALMNSKSSRRPGKRSPSAAMLSLSSTSSFSMWTRPGYSSTRSCSWVLAMPRTVPTTVQPRFKNSVAIPSPRPRDAPAMKSVGVDASPVSDFMDLYPRSIRTKFRPPEQHAPPAGVSSSERRWRAGSAQSVQESKKREPCDINDRPLLGAADLA